MSINSVLHLAFENLASSIYIRSPAFGQNPSLHELQQLARVRSIMVVQYLIQGERDREVSGSSLI